MALTPTKDPTVPLMVKLPASLKAKLEAYATEQSKNVSQVVREAITNTLSLDTNDASFPRTKRHPSTIARQAYHNEQARRARRLLRILAHNNPAALEALLEDASKAS